MPCTDNNMLMHTSAHTHTHRSGSESPSYTPYNRDMTPERGRGREGGSREGRGGGREDPEGESEYVKIDGAPTKFRTETGMEVSGTAF